MITGYIHAVFYGVTFFVWFLIATTFRFGFMMYFGPRYIRRYKQRKIYDYHPEKEEVVVLGTIYSESDALLQSGLTSVVKSLEDGASKYMIYIMVDGCGQYPEQGLRKAALAQALGPNVKVYLTNATWKRMNLYNLMTRAAKAGHLYKYLGFLDCDTQFRDKHVVRNCLRPFGDERVGGVTTFQHGFEPTNVYETVGSVLEAIRRNGPQAAGAEWGQIPCLPGRFYMVLRDALLGIPERSDRGQSLSIEERLEAYRLFFIEDYWSTPKGKVQAHAGDDRQNTSRILRNGYKTVQAPDAEVETELPDTYHKFRRTIRRWSTSYQGTPSGILHGK